MHGHLTKAVGRHLGRHFKICR